MKLTQREVHALATEFIKGVEKKQQEELQRRWDALRPKFDALLTSPEWLALAPILGECLEDVQNTLRASRAPSYCSKRELAQRIADAHGMPLFDESTGIGFSAVERAIILSAIGAKTVEDIMEMLEKKFL